MGLINRIRSALRMTGTTGDTISLSTINEFFKGTNARSDITEIVYFTCLKTLAESMGKLPCYLEDIENRRQTGDESFLKVLGVQPNRKQTSVQFFTYMEFCRYHYGNAYAYIKYDSKGEVEGLYPLHPQQVTIYVNNTSNFTNIKYYYNYSDTRNGKSYNILPEDIIHVKAWITGRDGYAGKPVKEILAEYMSGNKNSQVFLNDLYKSGLTANAVVKYLGDMSGASRKKITDQMVELSNRNTGRIIPMPIGWDIQPLNLKLTDSQFFELRKYTGSQIAAAFGVKPSFLNDYEKTSYSSSSAENLAFYVGALLYNITCWEQELTIKLLTDEQVNKGMKFKFDFDVILRADPTSQAESLAKYVSGAIYTVNEARHKAGLPPQENGDIILVNGTYVPLGHVGDAYKNMYADPNAGSNNNNDKGVNQ